MFPAILFLPVDVGAQVALTEGWDSNARQRFDANGTLTRQAAPYTAIEGSLGAHFHGRSAHHEIRALGRLQWYTPFDKSFDRRDGIVGLSVISSTPVGYRSMITFGSVATLGSVQAARGTDAAPIGFDVLSVRRVAWLTTNNLSISQRLDRQFTYTQSFGVIFGGTVSEELPGNVSPHRGVDFFTGSARASLAKALTTRTSVEARLWVDRTHTIYLLDRFGPVPRNIGPMDSMAMTHTVGFSHVLTRELTEAFEGGGTIAAPRIGDKLQLLPYVSASLNWRRENHSLLANVGFRYSLSDPRIGPGSMLYGTLFYFGQVTRDRSLYLVASLSASRTAILGGADVAGRVTSLGASIAVRYQITTWLGALAGYDGRYSAYEGPFELSPFLRHLAFIGISGAWSTQLGTPPITTFASNTPPPT